MKTRVLLADPHECIRGLMHLALAQEGSCEVVAQTGSGEEVLSHCHANPSAILILESLLPDISGAELVRTVRGQWQEMRVLVFSGSKNREALLEVLEASPHGFVHKGEPLSVFYEVLRAVARGSRYYSQHAVRLLDSEKRTGNPLSPRERAVLALLARGLSSKQIAGELHLSQKTVDHYRATLMTKLNIHDVAGLTRYALRTGLANMDW